MNSFFTNRIQEVDNTNPNTISYEETNVLVDVEADR